MAGDCHVTNPRQAVASPTDCTRFPATDASGEGDRADPAGKRRIMHGPVTALPGTAARTATVTTGSSSAGTLGSFVGSRETAFFTLTTAAKAESSSTRKAAGTVGTGTAVTQQRRIAD